MRTPNGKPLIGRARFAGSKSLSKPAGAVTEVAVVTAESKYQLDREISEKTAQFRRNGYAIVSATTSVSTSPTGRYSGGDPLFHNEYVTTITFRKG